MTSARLFRWVGSKTHLVERLAPGLREELRSTGGRVVSLFYGSGSLEQAIAPSSPQLAAEANPDLRCLYRALVKAPESVATAIKRLDALHGRTRESFAQVRALDACCLPALERAARFLWLSTMSFNGLWRVNRRGEHNVPPDSGRLARPSPFPSLKQLLEASTRLRLVEFLVDWRQAAASAREGDLVISDPPYLGGFEAYTASGFGTDEQRVLVSALKTLVERGCAVVAFNAPKARPLYARLGRVELVHRSGRMSSDGSRRQAVGELIVTAGFRSARVRAA